MRWVLGLLMLGGFSLEAADFLHFSDMCDPTPEASCPNKPEEVRALQAALNGDPKLFLFIRESGQWDVATRDAVVVFQEHYGVHPAQGYVGPATRRMLERLYGSTAARTASADGEANTSTSAESKETATAVRTMTLPAKASKASQPTYQKRSSKPAASRTPRLPAAKPAREFVLYADMCDNTIEGNHCPNKPIEVSNLQILLNADPNLNVHIATDGKWGKSTQKAVVAFQKHYNIAPASGYVGPKTKRMLDRVAGAIVAKAVQSAPRRTSQKSGKSIVASSWKDMCDRTETDLCPNRPEDVRALQRFLGITADGKWGKGTKAAVIEFQKKHNITPASGYVGAKTRRAIQKAAATSRKQSAATPRRLHRGPIKTYADFRRYTNYPVTYKIYKNDSLLAHANRRNTRIKIDVAAQRLKVYVGGKIALDSPCTTGAKRKLEPNTRTIRDKSTPKGTFRVTEKLEDKRSTIFGRIYRNGKLVYRGDRRKYKGSWEGAKFVGASLKNWMRLTDSGIGLHASHHIKRHPASNGCIRLPYRVSSAVFKTIQPGTKVQIN